MEYSPPKPSTNTYAPYNRPVLLPLLEPARFVSRRYQRTLRAHGLSGSMGRAGVTGPPRDELRLAIITWIERTYHRRRHQRALGKLTPVEFEAIIHNQLPQAA